MDIVKSGINVESPLNAESGGQEELLEVAEGQQVGLGGFGTEVAFHHHGFSHVLCLEKCS